MCKKELNNSISETSQLEKLCEKNRNELVHAKQSLLAVKKDNEVLMNNIPHMQREIMNRKKLSTQDQKEIEELDK